MIKFIDESESILITVSTVALLGSRTLMYTCLVKRYIYTFLVKKI